MPYYVRFGDVPPKRHTLHKSPAGGYLFEELMSTAGFVGPSALLYHLHQPTSFIDLDTPEELNADDVIAPLETHRAFRFNRSEPEGDFLSGRKTIASNGDMSFSVVRPAEEMSTFYRNGLHDELVVIASGSGVLESVFGEITYGPLDMIYIPRGTTISWRYEEGSQFALVVESNQALRPLRRFRDTEGHFLEKSPYHERDLHPPKLVDPIDQTGAFKVAVKVGNRVLTHTLETHPYDVVGWDGNLFPFKMNMADFEPVSGRIHQMPDMLAVFEAQGFVVCCLSPARREDHPLALPAQPFHSNLDYDEIVYLLCNEDNPERALHALTLHPRSVPHGPKPGQIGEVVPERSKFYALMVDVGAALDVHEGAAQFENQDYGKSWTEDRWLEKDS